MIDPSSKGSHFAPSSKPPVLQGFPGPPCAAAGHGTALQKGYVPGEGVGGVTPLSFAGEWLTQVSQKASSQQTALAGLVPFQPRSSAQFPTPTCTWAHQPSLHTGNHLLQMRKTRATRRRIQQLNSVTPKAGSAASLPWSSTTGRCQPAGGQGPGHPACSTPQ